MKSSGKRPETFPSCMVIEPQNLKILPSLLRGYHTQNLKILLSLLWISHLTISKFCQLCTRTFFGLVILLIFIYLFIYLFICLFIMETGRINVPIIITIVSYITMLVSNNVFFGYLMPMRHGFNKTPSSASPNFLSPWQVFHQIFLLFYNKFFNILLLWSDYCKR